MPITKEVNCIALFLNEELPLFISAITPTAMYMNPPAVNPCANYRNAKGCRVN